MLGHLSSHLAPFENPLRTWGTDNRGRNRGGASGGFPGAATQFLSTQFSGLDLIIRRPAKLLSAKGMKTASKASNKAKRTSIFRFSAVMLVVELIRV